MSKYITIIAVALALTACAQTRGIIGAIDDPSTMTKAELMAFCGDEIGMKKKMQLMASSASAKEAVAKACKK